MQKQIRKKPTFTDTNLKFDFLDTTILHNLSLSDCYASTNYLLKLRTRNMSIEKNALTNWIPKYLVFFFLIKKR